MEDAGLSRRGFLKLSAASVSVGVSAAALGNDRAEAAGAWSGAPKHFVLIHGAWHGAWCWYKITAALQRHGQQVTALDLPGAGVDPTPPRAATRQAQVDRVTALLDTLPEPIILVGHSAGGAVVSAVADARPQKIEKLVYLTAFLLPDGVSLAEVGTADTGSLLNGNLVTRPDGSIDVAAAARREVFYNTCNPRDVALAEALFKPIGAQALVVPLRLGNNFAGVRRFYISCGRDHAISPAAQQSMYTAMPCEKVFSLDSDHSPFFSHPRKLVLALREVADA